MIYEQSNFPCKCGHKSKLHNMVNKFWFDKYFKSDVCLSGLDSSGGCKCPIFKLDNLDYLEKIYEQRT